MRKAEILKKCSHRIPLRCDENGMPQILFAVSPFHAPIYVKMLIDIVYTAQNVDNWYSLWPMLKYWLLAALKLNI